MRPVTRQQDTTQSGSACVITQNLAATQNVSSTVLPMQITLSGCVRISDPFAAALWLTFAQLRYAVVAGSVRKLLSMTS